MNDKEIRNIKQRELYKNSAEVREKRKYANYKTHSFSFVKMAREEDFKKLCEKIEERKKATNKKVSDIQ